MKSMMQRSLCALILLAVSITVLGMPAPEAAADETKLLRYPDLAGKRVVFTYAGDLWTVADSGGQARRLTAHEGLEIFAKFSPDGERIAFTGQYEGDEQVYVMPADGGEPKQLTFYPSRGPLPDRWGYDHHVHGWTPDGERILFRSMQGGWSLVDNRLYTVSADGGMPEVLPMPRAGSGDFAPDGKRLAYSPLFRDFRTWKRYQGGWAQDLYIYDPKGKHIQITDHVRTDRDPMWIGNRVYFASDRDGTLNLYRYDLKSKKTSQVTHSKKFDVRWPSRSSDGRIIYELGGRLHILNTKDGVQRELVITVPTDHIAARSKRLAVDRFIEGYELSPTGKRALVVARGDIFTLPAANGPTRNLTGSSDAHEKMAAWSPDGKQIAFLSDASGEEELYVMDAQGRSPAKRLTHDGDQMRYDPRWSPDNKQIAYSDKSGRLFVVDVESEKSQLAAEDKSGQLRDYAWSPKGGYLAMTLSAANGSRALHIWSRQDGKLRRVTSDDFNEFDPAWSPDGKYLFYLSDRQFAPQIGAWEWNYVGNRETGLYAIALRKDVPHPFPPKIDDEPATSSDAKKTDAAKPAPQPTEASQAKKKGKKKRGKKNRKKSTPDKKDAETREAKESATDSWTKIDFDGLGQRVARAPLPDDNYGGLSAVEGKLLLVKGGAFYYGRGSENPPELQVFDLASRKASTLANSRSYAISADRKKVLIRKGSGFAILDIAAGKGSSKDVSTSGLVADVDPRQEWNQIFHEVWRRYRDFFYVDNLHGYDWVKLRKQYEPLLEHVGHRTDLNYVIGEMIAELNVGHAYNAGGDFAASDRPSVALLGARLELDKKSECYRIVSILQGHNEETIYRSPLTEIGVDAAVGDYLLAVDGEPLEAGDNPYRLLRHKAGQPVELTLNKKPKLEGARTVQVQPISAENDLNYLNWVLDNRRRVAEATNGKVGYLHLPNMGAEGIREFTKWYYSQTRKGGLIVDVRSNGGGNVSQMVIERLQRKLLATGFSRNNQFARTYPYTVFHGHLVCLLDENSASDGDIFPAMFREAGLGPLIGKRSWGGVIGITNRGALIDGGSVNVPEFGFSSADGKWIIEGYGVDPDIEVENDPLKVIQGEDPQLERGIAEVLKRMQQSPKRLPERPAPPVKTR